ncbi:MAG TPA: short-chain dehydrogenase, partial [Candidatus Kapabacteria bacterium]|nr:short-chain dehydrogenase [Candidatus Kapabacteria bacterium]
AHLLKLIAVDFDGALSYTPEDLSIKAQDILETTTRLRSQIISIGIPILLSDGKKLVRGKQIKIPPAKLGTVIELNDIRRDEFAREGWVDLRSENMAIWQQRLGSIREEVEDRDSTTGSEPDRSPAYWDNFTTLNEGRLAAWIFTFEEGGERVKR